MKQQLAWIIDDDHIVRVTAAIMIKKANEKNEVVTFPHAELAFQFIMGNLAYENLLPDIIFLDINMPFMNGWEFLENFEKIKVLFIKPVRVFLISSSNCPADIERAQKTCASGYLIKPLASDVFESLARVSTHVSGDLVEV